MTGVQTCALPIYLQAPQPQRGNSEGWGWLASWKSRTEDPSRTVESGQPSPALPFLSSVWLLSSNCGEFSFRAAQLLLPRGGHWRGTLHGLSFELGNAFPNSRATEELPVEMKPELIFPSVLKVLFLFYVP